MKNLQQVKPQQQQVKPQQQQVKSQQQQVKSQQQEKTNLGISQHQQKVDEPSETYQEIKKYPSMQKRVDNGLDKCIKAIQDKVVGNIRVINEELRAKLSECENGQCLPEELFKAVNEAYPKIVWESPTGPRGIGIFREKLNDSYAKITALLDEVDSRANQVDEKPKLATAAVKLSELGPKLNGLNAETFKNRLASSTDDGSRQHIITSYRTQLNELTTEITKVKHSIMQDSQAGQALHHEMSMVEKDLQLRKTRIENMIIKNKLVNSIEVTPQEYLNVWNLCNGDGLDSITKRLVQEVAQPGKAELLLRAIQGFKAKGDDQANSDLAARRDYLRQAANLLPYNDNEASKLYKQAGQLDQEIQQKQSATKLQAANNFADKIEDSEIIEEQLSSANNFLVVWKMCNGGTGGESTMVKEAQQGIASALENAASMVQSQFAGNPDSGLKYIANLEAMVLISRQVRLDEKDPKALEFIKDKESKLLLMMSSIGTQLQEQEISVIKDTIKTTSEDIIKAEQHIQLAKLYSGHGLRTSLNTNKGNKIDGVLLAQKKIFEQEHSMLANDAYYAAAELYSRLGENNSQSPQQIDHLLKAARSYAQLEGFKKTTEYLYTRADNLAPQLTNLKQERLNADQLFQPGDKAAFLLAKYNAAQLDQDGGNKLKNPGAFANSGPKVKKTISWEDSSKPTSLGGGDKLTSRGKEDDDLFNRKKLTAEAAQEATILTKDTRQKEKSELYEFLDIEAPKVGEDSDYKSFLAAREFFEQSIDAKTLASLPPKLQANYKKLRGAYDNLDQKSQLIFLEKRFSENITDKLRLLNNVKIYNRKISRANNITIPSIGSKDYDYYQAKVKGNKTDTEAVIKILKASGINAVDITPTTISTLLRENQDALQSDLAMLILSVKV